MGDFGAGGGERITIRNINTASQGLVELEPPHEDERDSSSNILDRDALRDVGPVGCVNSKRAFDSDCELETAESLRHQKRKQRNNNKQFVSSECTPNYQPSCSEQGVHDGRLRETKSKLARERQAIGPPETARSSKRRRETSNVHEVGLDISLRTDGSHRLHGLGFDISVSSSLAVGIKHATCSILPDKDADKAMGARVAVDVVNKNSAGDCKREQRVAGHCEISRGTTTNEALRVSNKDLCSMSTTVTSGQKSLEDLVRAASLSDKMNFGKTEEFVVAKSRQGPPMLENICQEDQAESQKLPMAVAALHSQLDFLHNLAENGSKDCKQCESVKDGLRNLLSNYCEKFIIQKSSKPAATSEQRLSSEEELMCNSPLGSGMIENLPQEHEDCKAHLQDAIDGESMDTGLPSEMDIQTHNEELPGRVNFNEDFQEVSGTECHLCIELGSPQSDDAGSVPAPDRREREEYHLMSSQNDGPYSLDRLHTCLEDNQTNPLHVLGFGEVSSELKRDKNSRQAIEDGNKDEESSAKNSKGEGCWNSVITRNSGDSYGIDDQAERDGYIDLRCGCTSQKYGDTLGILRLYQNGKLEIQCQCSIGCINGERMSPASFERHGGRGASKKWRDTNWIVLGDEKVQFSKVKGLDAFVRRYKETSRSTTRQPALPKQSIHRDEFLQCTKCLKRRRFRQKTKEECRLFHEASMNAEWECSDHPNESFRSCQDEEEREARQAYRGCIRSRTCPGCLECVCVGCFLCRLEDCQCRLCKEFVANNK